MARTRRPRDDQRPSPGLPKRTGSLFKWIERVVRQIRNVRQTGAGKPRKDQDEALYQALALGYSLARKATRSPALRLAIAMTCTKRGIPRPKEGANRFLRLAKLLFPDRHSGDHHRYAKLWQRGFDKGWKGQDLIANLKRHGGLAAIINAPTESVRYRRSEEEPFEIGSRRYNDAVILGTFKPAHSPESASQPSGNVILLARSAEGGNLDVFVALDNCPKLWRLALIETGRRTVSAGETYPHADSVQKVPATDSIRVGPPPK